MKLKKILIFTLCLFSLFMFTGCGRNVTTKPLEMERYYNSKVISKYSTSGKKEYNLSSFIANEVDSDTLFGHTSLTFNGVTNWLYGMYVECVYFYFYSSKAVEVNQLEFKITELEGGTEDITLNKYKVEEILSLNAPKEEGVLLRVNVNQRVSNNESVIEIKLNDALVDYNWTIYGLQVYGETRYSK